MNAYYILTYCITCYLLAVIWGHSTWNRLIKKFTQSEDPTTKAYADAVYNVWKHHPSIISMKRNPIIILMFIIVFAINIPFVLPLLFILYLIHVIRKAMRKPLTAEQMQIENDINLDMLNYFTDLFNNPAHAHNDLKQMGVNDELLKFIKEANIGVSEKIKGWKDRMDVINHYTPFHARVKDQVPDFNQFCYLCRLDLENELHAQKRVNPLMSEPVKERDYSNPDSETTQENGSSEEQPDNNK